MQQLSLQQPDQINAIQASNDAEMCVRCSDVVALLGKTSTKPPPAAAMFAWRSLLSLSGQTYSVLESSGPVHSSD